MIAGIFCMHDILKCYVSGRPVPDHTNQGTVSFAVPELGIIFRSSATGSRTDLEFIAFLSFLRFAEHNKEIFAKKELHIFTDNPILMYLMNQSVTATPETEAVLREASRAMKILSCKVKWIEPHMNRAAAPIGSIPDLPADTSIKIKTFANLAIQKPVTDLSGWSKL